MSLPALAVLHGNAHAADWWDLGRSIVSTVTSGSSRWISSR